MLRVLEASHYPIYFGGDILNSEEWRNHWMRFPKKIVVIFDSNIEKIYKSRLQNFFQSLSQTPLFLSFPAGEKFKTRETKQLLEDQMLSAGCGRDSILLAVGGGVTCDLVGFLAATFCRGIPVTYMPTSLMAMVDASIGGKTGVNTSAGKNLIGCFSFPESVWMPVDWLTTLGEKEFISGMAEVIKHAVILKPEFLQWLMDNRLKILAKDLSILTEMILQSCEIKNRVVKDDAFESGYREILNFGHTIGHAIEVFEEYQWSHGDAVALGMRIEAIIACRLGYLSTSDVKFLDDVLRLFGFTRTSEALMNSQHIEKILYQDKKNKQHQIHVVLLKQLGAVHHKDKRYSFPVELDVIKSAIQDFQRSRCSSQ